jgi:pimeloyl-ACP methyl ester carboxylesterase
VNDIASFSHAGATLIAETGGGPRQGPVAGGTTYILIHGIGMGRTIFTGLVETLQERASARTVAVDLPGYGAAPEPWRVLTMERTADLLAALLRSRGFGPVVVIGHSMGTQVAVELAARHPDLVAGVVLLAPTVNRRERTAAWQVLRLAQDLAVESPKVIYVGAREYLRAGPNLRLKFRAMLVHRPETTYPRVLVPALVLRGENDYVSPRAWCRFVAACLPQGRLAEVEGHGHETMIRDAAPAAALIVDFVRHG